MCGIVGYIGNKQAGPILLEGLTKLEYRGYDSAGIAVRNEDGEVQIVRAKGKLKNLSDKTNEGTDLKGTCGIGHTRWATHGEPSEKNAHPHYSENDSVVIVHNGIIENYAEIKEKLIEYGYKFYSQTDTEVVAKLLDYYYHEIENDPLDAIKKFMLRVRGSYALAIMYKDCPNEIYVVRKDSPMIIGVADGETFIASDVPAMLKYTRDVYYIDNMELARITAGQVSFFNVDEEEVKKELVHITMDETAAEKNGFEHFMMKEIHEQPEAIRNTIKSVVHDDMIDIEKIGLNDEKIKEYDNIFIIGCGSAYHVGVALKYVFENITKIPVQVDFASEFRYRNPLLSEHTLVILISQSGETADTIAALKETKKLGADTLSIVNVVGSSISRLSQYVFYTLAGPEIAVATTKAYSAQLVAGYLLAVAFAKSRGVINEKETKKYIEEICELPDKVESLIKEQESIQHLASIHSNILDVFMIGRGIDYAICLEGSLKMKEVSYIHTEAYAAGELKHGTISLIEDGILVVGVLTQKSLVEKTLSNMQETKSRGAKLLAIAMDGISSVKSCDYVINIPKTNPLFAASLAVVPLQIMSYYLSVLKGLDVDKPRNLAKSVTVE